MRFMVLLKVEAAVGPDLARAIEAYDAELARAGVADPRRCAARGKRVAAEPAGDGRILAGFWVFDLESRDEAAAWVRRCPAPADGSAKIEIRLLLEPGDLTERPKPAARRRVWERAMAF
ncbi:YciI family protein [uncultured Caulobacter sp.]|uniref:YciI family protein n=1 Tax=uncultured Caulobacter sp. TaxID=158749 RepID=UPI00261DEB54|nr:YciI family protein [uncultured Caulobacter sp.]